MICNNKIDGVCKLHNLHCAYPKCEIPETRKIVIGAGGFFNLSIQALKQLVLRKALCLSIDNDLYDIMGEWQYVGGNFEVNDAYNWIRYNQNVYVINDKRDDPVLVSVVEELGVRANGEHGELKIVEIPGDVEWHLHELEDGREVIHEQHRVWQ